jgi:hypothetical protein
MGCVHNGKFYQPSGCPICKNRPEDRMLPADEVLKDEKGETIYPPQHPPDGDFKMPSAFKDVQTVSGIPGSPAPVQEKPSESEGPYTMDDHTGTIYGPGFGKDGEQVDRINHEELNEAYRQGQQSSELVKALIKASTDLVTYGVGFDEVRVALENLRKAGAE